LCNYPLNLLHAHLVLGRNGGYRCGIPGVHVVVGVRSGQGVTTSPFIPESGMEVRCRGHASHAGQINKELLVVVLSPPDRESVPAFLSQIVGNRYVQRGSLVPRPPFGSYQLPGRPDYLTTHYRGATHFGSLDPTPFG
jgi:hypothetical protein